MSQFLAYLVPLFGFMLIPVWIPIIAIAAGAVMDRVAPVELTAAGTAVEAAKERAQRLRSHHQLVLFQGGDATADDALEAA